MSSDRPGPAEGRDGPGRPRHPGLALALICSAQLIVVIDVTVVNIAIPSIHQALRFSGPDLGWLITSYAVTFGGLLLLGGRTGDLYGKRRMFMIGVAIFAASSLMCGLALDDVWLIVARGTQGIGAAVAAPAALSLIATNFAEGQERNRAIGVFAAVGGIGGAMGQVLGGVLTSYAGWRWVFFVNVPICAAILLLTPRAIGESTTTAGRLDVRGAATVTGGMLLLVYGLTTAADSWASFRTLFSLGCAAILFVLFALSQRHGTELLMPLRIFSDRSRAVSYLLVLCTGLAITVMLYFLTLFMQNVLGYSPVRTGLCFLPMPLSFTVGARISSSYLVKINSRLAVILGSVCLLAGMAWIARLSGGSRYSDVLGPLIVLPFGMGLSMVPLQLSAVRGVAAHETGIAAGLVNTMQQMGGALGIAALTTVAVGATDARLRHLRRPSTETLNAALTHGYTMAFLVAAGVCAAGLAIAAAFYRSPKSTALEKTAERASVVSSAARTSPSDKEA